MLATIMIIRHAEKPDASAEERGVTSAGRRDKHDLSVIGWQRAGALPHLFAAASSGMRGKLASPRTIYAACATKKSKSRRPLHTVEPLGKLLGVPVDHSHWLGEEAKLAEAVSAAAMPVLVAWHHAHIPALARAIAGDDPAIPADWPDDRFDLVWRLDADESGRWHFSQVPQMLLPGDQETPIG